MGQDKYIRPPTGGDPNTVQQVDATDRAVRTVLPEWARSGRLLEGIQVLGTAGNHAHGLGRAYRGWIVVRDYGAGGAPHTVYETTSPDSTKYLTLIATAVSKVSVWVW